MLPENIKKILEKQHYRIVGKHSAVQICAWTKKSLLNKGFCYKEKFYGISSHRCCQMSPFIACQNRCIHCWRPIELTSHGLDFNFKDFDKPKEIIEKCIAAQRKLLTGFGGNQEINKKKLKEAQEPNQFAISLIGEPTLYPYLPELIAELKKQRKTSFIVTNGLRPDKLLELKEKKALPTQLYLSLNTPNKEMYEKWHKSKIKNAWWKFNKSLEIFKKLDTRRVIRITLVKDINMKDEENYAKLILKAEPNFVEVKAFMSVGFSRKRISYEKMPSHSEIKEFAQKILKFLPGYKLLDEQEISRVVLIGKSEEMMKIKPRRI